MTEWQDSAEIKQALENTFNEILNGRMHGLPVINPELSVQALDFCRFDSDWLGVLITPWFMNLMLLPGCAWPQQKPGAKIEKRFPYGAFEFTLAHEAKLGTYALCSLFSPMFQFENQQAAKIAAETALEGLLEIPKPHGLSRRNLLRGAIT